MTNEIIVPVYYTGTIITFVMSYLYHYDIYLIEIGDNYFISYFPQVRILP